MTEPLEQNADDHPPPLVARVFRNRFEHLRAGWRMAAYAVTVVVLVVPFGILVAAIQKEQPAATLLSWQGSLGWLAGNAALLLAGLLVLRFVDRRPVALLGLGSRRGWLRELVAGLVAGIVVTGILAGILVISGSVDLELAPDAGSSLQALPLLVWIFTLAAALEELFFRGYLMQALAEGTRPWFAGLVTTVAFTWAHADNPDVTMVGIGNIFLAGVILALLYFRTRRLWLPIAFHLSWNLCQSWLWGFDVSGIEIEDRLLAMRPVGPELVTGGGFGLEGSLVTTALFVPLCAWLLVTTRLRPAEGVAALWEPYPTGFGRRPSVDPEPPADREEAVGSAVADGPDDS